MRLYIYMGDEKCDFVKVAPAAGTLNYDAAVEEMLLSIKRAGADVIITYLAKDFAMGRG